jgi:chromosome segregation ATPase
MAKADRIEQIRKRIEAIEDDYWGIYDSLDRAKTELVSAQRRVDLYKEAMKSNREEIEDLEQLVRDLEES